MPRRQSPNVLLFGFGLALLLSLGFNFFLLFEKTSRQNKAADQIATLTGSGPVDSLVWQERLQACSHDNLLKDSLIQALEQEVKNKPNPADNAQPSHASQSNTR